MSLLLLLKGAGEAAPEEPTADSPSTRLRIRESPRLDLHYEAETPSGRYYRWGKDEPKPENVPSGGGFSSTMPNGFETLRVTLPRKPGVDYSDLERLTTIRALGPGGDIRSEVRLERAPRTSGDQFSIGPEAKGWYAHLEDDPTAAEIYRDVDLNSWIGPSRARANTLNESNFPVTGGADVQVDASTGIPSLRLHVDGSWASPYKPTAEAWFDAGPSALAAKVYYDMSGGAITAFILQWSSSTSDAALVQTSSDIYTATTGAATVEPSAARRFFCWTWNYSETPAGADGFEFYVDLRRLAVYGDHGLTLQGTEPAAGFLASDIIADVVSRWAPLLRFTTGVNGTIRPTSFVIPHLSFKEKTRARVIIEAANQYELQPFAVWENRTFYYHAWGERGRKWRTRVAPSQLTETGPTVERLRNGIVVEWQDPDGSTRSAGPIGSGCTVETSELEDRDPENPANQMGLKMYGEPVSIGFSVESEAIRIGAMNLARFRETDTSGQMTLVGTIEDDKGVVHPVSRVRAGDTIVPVDASDTRERRIVRADYNEDSLTTTVDLDAPPEGTPDLIAQAEVALADLAL